MKFRPVIRKEMSFKEKFMAGRTDDGWMDDGQRPITIVDIEPSAQVKLKSRKISKQVGKLGLYL